MASPLAGLEPRHLWEAFDALRQVPRPSKREEQVAAHVDGALVPMDSHAVHQAGGGRVAEEIVFSNVSSGASNDLERASEIARDMVTRLGMSGELGPLIQFLAAGLRAPACAGEDP